MKTILFLLCVAALAFWSLDKKFSGFSDSFGLEQTK